ncbi:TIM barrel protein [uncultured Tateyamaria sp.]|uniref:hydroxypyruvate isomerase family protein n=1 Tax=uncultured Tateyamaria sp. TaxID=455651 RepID=UPI002604FFDD|nr:TIM barrel protein [uncultured Tateyamaria sp.]
MPRFAANLTHLWAELPYLDRFDAAAEAGFEAVEVLFPYDVPAPETLRALRRNGLQMVLLNAPGPNYTGGARGFAAVPGGAARFDYDMRRAVRYAQALGAGVIHVMSGDGSGAEAKAAMVENLRRATASLPEGLCLTLEPLNAGAMPGYFLDSYDLAAEIIEAVDAPNLGLQYDSYHAQEITGDALGTFHAMRPLIRHIQIGDAPGRVTPGRGRVDFAALFAAIDASGYDGWVSAEYTPKGRTETDLAWMMA